ncbi:MAG: D-cysteine desulfhydrase family protein [Chloroflexi bacterium]|jgi:D-cysteine desulfhydrase family pyridoxal phosphate-dependent enzyme|nr:D-cysteine desulfhydrase family protein [Chloroflexota bacterium]MBT3670924.1 D-cysteine desulfhydrase family protein [Chloroflexota bacterium]MBT4002753.1 D-cysteine desulfhydrase family protein [Chloroflexota bacterium]MBT4306362.1 D-cysteine desulfhydrase family protein [Chloroflexota bacterium]MBT4532757.1 D-cysteine desulfhydrase family protein [Chloroflexota bacterium]
MKELPRSPIAHLPTPIESLPRLTANLGGPKIIIKRDDQTGLALGGNKTRKLEYLLAEAESLGCKTLITAGAIQSNHCRQTAAAARRVGMDCILVLNGEEPEDPVGNIFLDLLLGAEIVWTTKKDRQDTLEKVAKKAEIEGKKPYLVPYGGSNPTGAAAYVYAMQEFVEQSVKADWIVFATSSGGTHAGLALGKEIFGFKGKVLGISIDELAEPFAKKIYGLVKDTALLLDHELQMGPEEIRVNGDYLGGGYAVMGELEKEAIRLFASEEGVLIDPVYTGRAAGGMIDLIRKGFFRKDETVLFWHTGGTPALFAEKYRKEILT